MRHSTLDHNALRYGVVLVALAASGILATLLVGTETAGPVPERAHRTPESSTTSSRQTSSPSLATQVPAFHIDAGAFAGTWHVRTEQLIIHPDGSGTAEWSIHTWCGIGSPPASSPCDSFQGSHIVIGGHTEIQLIAVNGNTAEALFARSTDPAELPDGPVTMSIAPDDVLTLSTGLGFGPLCGQAAAALTLPQQQAEGINCGA